MDSWTLQGDSYSFLRSAPSARSLCHRDGTPNRVEIFDIISVPNQRTAISETTCLCDIFGDDTESPSLSTVGQLVPSQGEADGTVASLVADDLNDSSGSYHSAQGFSEGEEGFEDSRERLCSPPLQGELSQRTQPQDTRHPKPPTDSNTNTESKSRPPSSFNNTSPTLGVFDSTERAPSPGHSSQYALTLEDRASSSSSSPTLVKETFSAVAPKSGKEAELRTNPLNFRNGSPSHQALTPRPLSESCVTPEPPRSKSPELSSIFSKEGVVSEPRSTRFVDHSTSPPEHTSKDFFLDFTQSTFWAEAIVPSPLSSDTDISGRFRGSLASPELENRPLPTDSQHSSPFPDLTRRVSVPDLFSRGSTPDADIYSRSPEQNSRVLPAERKYTPESQDTRLSPQTIRSASTTAPPHTAPSPVISLEPSPALADTGDSSPTGPPTPSFGLLCLDSPYSPGTRTPTLLSSPVMSHSLSPSPAVNSNCSPIDHRYTSPSPEIIITASSPEVGRKAVTPEEKTSASVILEPNFESTSPRSSASSPHITSISYSVVQPEEGDTSPFPELSRLSSPDLDLTVAPSEINHTPDSLTGPTGEAPDYLHGVFFRDSVEHSEIVNLPTYQTSSAGHLNLTPLSDTKSPTNTAGNYLTPSPQHGSKTPSPVSLSPEQRHDQCSPGNLCAKDYPNDCPLKLLECEWGSSSVDFTESQCPTHLAEESVSPSAVSDTSGTETKNKPPVALASSHVRASLLLAHENAENSQNRQRQEIEVTPQEVNLWDSLQEENISFNRPPELKPLSLDRVSEDGHSVSPQWVTPTSPVVSLGTPQPTDASYSPTFKHSSSLGRSCTPEYTQGQGSSSDSITGVMAHPQRRRRTPSPPLTRFTPVHIIAPQKPQRHWQNSSRSPSQVGASSASRNLKTAATNRESPDVAPADNNSPAYWGRFGTQLEIDREMQTEQVGEMGGERLMERRMERHGEGEEQLPEKGKGWPENAGYREEQVELSFSSRNRKGSLSGSAAHTSRQTSQGLPTVHSYSEGLRSSKQPKQQQKVIFASQSDSWGGGPERRHTKSGAAGGAAVNKLSQSSSSSMGSELDEADNEGNWFTDRAFSTLSSPEVDYLDVYNSSHCSSTNVSQPSTQESPAGLSAALRAYADFRDSAPNNDDHRYQQPSTPCTDGFDPSRCFELGSFECVDVAMEREDHKRSRRGVPKRQIQLKRKDSDERSQTTVLRPVRAEHFTREVLMRQHSTPVATAERFSTDCTRGNNQHQERKSKLQKSVSLDEACTKTKMATCLINNVLSKKMHSADPQPDEKPEENSPDFEENNPKRDNVAQSVRDPLKLDGATLSSSLPSDCCVVSSQTGSEKVETGSRQTGSPDSEISSKLKAPFGLKVSETKGRQVDDAKTKDGGKDEITAGTVRPPSEPKVDNLEAETTDRDEEREKPEIKQAALQSDRETPTSNEISPKGKDKKKTSLNVCLTPEAENKQEASSSSSSLENSHREKAGVGEKTEKEEKRNHQNKAPIHKVRDVRRLVKNTYSLSFKAAGAAGTSAATDDTMRKSAEDTRQETGKIKAEELTEVEPEIRKGKSRDEPDTPKMNMEPKDEAKELPTAPPPGNAATSCPQSMHIEYKAVCWKEDKNKLLCGNPQDDDASVQDEDRSAEVGREGRPPMLGSLPKQPGKEREVSTAVVVIRDGSSQTQTSAPAAQERIPTPPPASDASHSAGPAVPGSSGHSVSMLLKEKGYQADIGAVLGDNLNEAARKKLPCKHVNSLKIPLQNAFPSDLGQTQSTAPPAASDSNSAPAENGEDDGTGNNAKRQKSASLLRNALEQTRLPATPKECGDFEAVKRLDPTFPPRSPAVRRFRSQPIEVKSVSKELQKRETPLGLSGSRPQTIEVKSIAKKSQKPTVPPKPSCKFKPATESESELSEAQRPSHLSPPGKPQSEDRPQTIVVSSPTIYRKISHEVTSASNNARKLSVSAIASLKPPTCKPAEASSSSTLADRTTAASAAHVSHDSAGKQTPEGSQQSAGHMQRPTMCASLSFTGPGLDPEPVTSRVPEPAPAAATRPSDQPVAELDNQPECPPAAYPRQSLPPSINTTNQPQLPEYTPQPYRPSIPGERGRPADDLHFYASDDPPSYDDRESFSPLTLPELPSRRLNRYQPSSRPPPCSCPAGASSYSGAASHRHRSPHTLTPPAPRSPGQTLPCPLAQPPVHLHQARSDPQQTTYRAGSPKFGPVGPSQPPALYQPPPCLPHPSLIQTGPTDRPLQPFQPNESRRPSVRRSPQQQPAGVAAAPYCSPGHSHSPGLPHADPQYMCGPQGLGPAYGSEYGGDTSSLYSESTYGQTPRRVLLDPETGKYFYIEVPVQPLRKMLFDPETGQYVEVLIPQQAMSHSGLYPPSAAPYPPLHNPSMYAPAQQYMPYAAPPLAHPQAQSQPPRYPEASAAAPLHQSGPGVTYRNPTAQPPKAELQGHPPLNQSYLEGMYYVPTGMSASPNPTPHDYYKHPPNLPPTRGERS